MLLEFHSCSLSGLVQKEFLFLPLKKYYEILNIYEEKMSYMPSDTVCILLSTLLTKQITDAFSYLELECFLKHILEKEN